MPTIHFCYNHKTYILVYTIRICGRGKHLISLLLYIFIIIIMLREKKNSSFTFALQSVHWISIRICCVYINMDKICFVYVHKQPIHNILYIQYILLFFSTYKRTQNHSQCLGKSHCLLFHPMLFIIILLITLRILMIVTIIIFTHTSIMAKVYNAFWLNHFKE